MISLNVIKNRMGLSISILLSVTTIFVFEPTPSSASAFFNEIKCNFLGANEKVQEIKLVPDASYAGLSIRLKGQIQIGNHPITVYAQLTEMGKFISFHDNQIQLYANILSKEGTLKGNLSFNQGWFSKTEYEISCRESLITRAISLSELDFTSKKIYSIGEIHDGISLYLANTQILDSIRASHPGKIALVVEMFKENDQMLLNQFNERTVNFQNLMAASGWTSPLGWNYSPEAYELLFNKARALGMTIYGGDRNDRNSEAGKNDLKNDLIDLEANVCIGNDKTCFDEYRKYHARNLSMAKVARKLLQEDPGTTVVFYSGSTHAASLPWYFLDIANKDQILELHLSFRRGANQSKLNLSQNPISDWPVIYIGGTGSVLSTSDHILISLFTQAWLSRQK